VTTIGRIGVTAEGQKAEGTIHNRIVIVFRRLMQGFGGSSFDQIAFHKGNQI
jgi:hypothetical protein